MAGEIEIKGLSQLAALLDRINGKVRNKLVMRALHDGARLIRDEAKSRAPVGTGDRIVKRRRRQDGTVSERVVKGGLLKANIIEHADRAEYFKVLIRVRNSGYRRVGSRAGLQFKNPGSSPGYWWLVEFGTSQRPATPFLRPAFEGKKDDAIRAVVQSLARGIDAVAKESA